MQKNNNFFKAEDFFFFFFLHQSKILLMFKGREKQCRFIHKGLIFAWNSLNLHISVVGVCYCKGSYWRREQLPQKISHMAHTDILRKSKTLRRKRGIQDSTWEGRCEFFYAQRQPLTMSLSFPSFSLTNLRCPGCGNVIANQCFGQGGNSVSAFEDGCWLTHGKARFAWRKISSKPWPPTSASVIGRRDWPQRDVGGRRTEHVIIFL